MKAATLLKSFSAALSSVSIHAAREGGDVSPPRDWSKLAVSIHAAREGGDRSAEDAVIKEDVSIHAAREGGDRAAGMQGLYRRCFNPRRP